MSPASNPRTSELTVKQRRAVKRAEKLAKFRRQQKQRRRNRRIAAISIPVAVLVAVGAIILSIVLTPRQATYTAGGSGVAVEGVEEFTNAATHVETPVTYTQSPPAGGDHSPVWLNCGTYTQPVPDENAVHSLEHGAIWVTYDPSLEASQLGTLRSQLPTTHVILSPYDGLSDPIVLSGWNVQLGVESADDSRIEQFMEEYWQAENAPEPGATCTGGVDG
ncbi:DUF3105 domain-containing protein [Pseudolysinimonas yzui]|uniref:Membrane protein n=1 Tax=Pseudolysinimonas yzui TaxID=2708254 RepID=A0A8J3GPZ4_9MICO|nr:DUF3105 domain-containing protein [Pseudolysinimonas yzui]GHF12673.1 membrane protein [Pseudolysinimonas yzui]